MVSASTDCRAVMAARLNGEGLRRGCASGA
jgi:hypothetical protein